MIQFNLLPDIKIKYLKAQRQKHMVVLVSTMATIASIAIFVILISIVHVAQKKSLSDLNKDIQTSSKELQATPNLTKILTIQNQLGALTALHDKKPVTTRFFDYMSQLTPNEVSVAKANIDFTTQTIVVNGDTDTLATVNKYVDTLKFTKYTTDEVKDSKNAFSDVVLTTFSRSIDGATYTVTFKFDPVIFQNTSTAKLDVPQITSTRSQVEQPTALFQEGNN